MAAMSRSIVSRSAMATSGNGDRSLTSTAFMYERQLLQISTRRCLRDSTSAASVEGVTNLSPVSPQYTQPREPVSQAKAQNEQRSVRRSATTSAIAGHDPHAGQYPWLQAERAAPSGESAAAEKSASCSAEATGLTASSATSQTRSGASPRWAAPTRIAC